MGVTLSEENFNELKNVQFRELTIEDFLSQDDVDKMKRMYGEDIIAVIHDYIDDFCARFNIDDTMENQCIHCGLSIEDSNDVYWTEDEPFEARCFNCLYPLEVDHEINIPAELVNENPSINANEFRLNFPLSYRPDNFEWSDVKPSSGGDYN